MITIEPEDSEHYRQAEANGTASATDMPVARALQRATGLRWEASSSRAWYTGRRKERCEFLLPQPIYRLHRRVIEGLAPTGPLVFNLFWPPATEDEPAESAHLPADYFAGEGGADSA